ncbi:MAG: zinc-dependent metalloprotease family protein [Actinomycetota bacterium]
MLRTRTRRSAVLGVIGGILLLLSFAGSAAARQALAWDEYREGPRTDEEQDCDEFIPAESSVRGVTDDGRMVSVSVLTILDEVALAEGEEAMAVAAGAYREWNIDLQVSFLEAAFAPEGFEEGRPAISAQGLIDASKALVGGVRPEGADVVYTISSKLLTDAAGFADCIGGVRYPDRAFAVGELADELNLGLNFYVDGTGKIAAHEIGHLLGAHHHYANCAEGVSTDIVRDLNPAPCTVMFNYSDFQSAHFGTLEATVIRGHVLAFAGR